MEQLWHIIGFCLGILPMWYLGVPLIARRFSAQDYSSIVDKVQNRLVGLKMHPLSYARRLSLIKSMLQGSYIYWSGIFGLTRGVKRQIESIFACFLWVGLELKKKLHAISWENICKPYEEGGLNI